MSQIYSGSEINKIDFEDMEIVKTRKNRKTIEYYNIASSYDIETSSFRPLVESFDRKTGGYIKTPGRPLALVYSHMFDIDGHLFFMRTWDEFKDFLNDLSERAGLNYYKRMIIYVHNLGYEFSFMKGQIEFDQVFANGGDRDILTALTKNGIEFRCSYMLSGFNLALTAKNLMKHKIKKMNGDLDYSKLRTPLTPLTDDEMGYIVNDVKIIEYFIREAIEEAGDNITKIPLTNTGYVREYMRNNTILGNEPINKKSKELIPKLRLDPEEYSRLRRAFAGGYTHANPDYVGETLIDVTARDFISSYPARMLAYKFPMSSGEKYIVKNTADFIKQLENYNCLFYVQLNNIICTAPDSYISSSKALVLEGQTVNNGRVYSANKVGLWTTEVDFKIIMQAYDVESFNVREITRYKSGYLPTDFVKVLIKLFKDKTSLKGIEDAVAEYQRSKGMLNSTYGMCVTDILRASFEWNDFQKELNPTTGDLNTLIDRHNKDRRRFLFYPWGVWITAYARSDLFNIIMKLGDDYVYSDTDCAYYLNDKKNEHIFKEDNDRIYSLLQKAMEFHKIDINEISPADVKGNRHTIGLWSLDGRYTRFKTLGAKRYMVEKVVDGEKVISLTVSGVNKNHAIPYLIETYGDKIFDHFEEGLEIPPGKCGKSTHTYFDDEVEGFVEDYNGVVYFYNEKSGVNLEETSYRMSIADDYSEFLDFLRGKKVKAVK